MQYIEFGKQNEEVIILLHGGGLSWWNYQEVAELLQKRYHVILPILNGHAGSDKHFLSIEDNANDIITFIDGHYDGTVLAIGGLSLGGQILVEMLSQRKDICKYAIIESALVVPMKSTHKLIRPIFGMSYGLIKQKWFSKLQFYFLKIRKELYCHYYEDTCKIGKSDMISFLEANSDYYMNGSINDTIAHTYIIVGSKEQRKMIVSANMLHKAIKNSQMKIIEGYYHGEMSMNHAKEYVNLLEKFMDKSDGTERFGYEEKDKF